MCGRLISSTVFLLSVLQLNVGLIGIIVCCTLGTISTVGTIVIVNVVVVVVIIIVNVIVIALISRRRHRASSSRFGIALLC